MINDLIEAVTLEQVRIQDPRNRSRYFIFGKIGQTQSEDHLSFVFKNAPDRVRRDAKWAELNCEESLFKIGDKFLSGHMATSPNGLVVEFPIDELEELGVEVEWVQEKTDYGLDYVMDNRELVGYLHTFLGDRAETENELLSEIFEKGGEEVKPFISLPDFPKLNASQQRAVEKCVTQKATFVWGPPGTGKTKTMATLASCLVRAGKRVLVAALSNNAVDQLLLATVRELDGSAAEQNIARLGSTMHSDCRRFGRDGFLNPASGESRAWKEWNTHVKKSLLVAANFTMLTFPRAADPGKFDYVIADEVSMANLPNLAALTFFASSAVVLGGDPFQLPPIYPDDADVPNDWFRLNVFEQAGIDDPNDRRVAFLDTQYRMQPEIGELISDMFYKNELKTGTARLPAPGDFKERVVFIDSPGPVSYMGQESGGRQEQKRLNQTHAQVVAAVVKSMLLARVRIEDIGVVTPYNAQVAVIRRELEEAGLSHNASLRLKVSTIHAFQGQERRVMIVDFTDDNVRPTLLTAKWELINVALSRAKEQLVIVGNRDYLQNDKYFGAPQIEMFRKMLSHCTVVRSDELV